MYFLNLYLGSIRLTDPHTYTFFPPFTHFDSKDNLYCKIQSAAYFQAQCVFYSLTLFHLHSVTQPWFLNPPLQRIHFSAGIFLKQIPGSEKPLDNSISNNTDIINNSTLTFHYYFYFEISKCYVHYTSQILEEMGQFYSYFEVTRKDNKKLSLQVGPRFPAVLTSPVFHSNQYITNIS